MEKLITAPIVGLTSITLAFYLYHYVKEQYAGSLMAATFALPPVPLCPVKQAS